jgi:hypothetical protein
MNCRTPGFKVCFHKFNLYRYDAASKASLDAQSVPGTLWANSQSGMKASSAAASVPGMLWANSQSGMSGGGGAGAGAWAGAGGGQPINRNDLHALMLSELSQLSQPLGSFTYQ